MSVSPKPWVRGWMSARTADEKVSRGAAAEPLPEPLRATTTSSATAATTAAAGTSHARCLLTMPSRG